MERKTLGPRRKLEASRRPCGCERTRLSDGGCDDTGPQPAPFWNRTLFFSSHYDPVSEERKGRLAFYSGTNSGTEG